MQPYSTGGAISPTGREVPMVQHAVVLPNLRLHQVGIASDSLETGENRVRLMGVLVTRRRR
jgi:hypothetical protein